MTLRFVAVLLFFALLAVSADIFLKKRIEVTNRISAALYACGNQKMLCQKATLLATLLVHNADENEKQRYAEEMARCVQSMAAAAKNLLYEGVSSSKNGLEIKTHSYSDQIELNQALEEFLNVAGQILASSPNAFQPDNKHYQQLIQTAFTVTLPALSNAVLFYKKETEARLGSLQILERTNLFLAVVVLFLMATFIFRPLVLSVRRHLNERRMATRQHDKLVKELQDALANVKTLHGLIPICAECKNIRNGEGQWLKLEDYISTHSNADFTHGYCMDCQYKFEMED